MFYVIGNMRMIVNSNVAYSTCRTIAYSSDIILVFLNSLFFISGGLVSSAVGVVFVLLNVVVVADLLYLQYLTY